MPIHTYAPSTRSSVVLAVGTLIPVLVDPTVREIEWLLNSSKRLMARPAASAYIAPIGIIAHGYVFITLAAMSIVDLLRAATDMSEYEAEETLRRYIYFGIATEAPQGLNGPRCRTVVFFNSPHEPEARRKLMEHRIIRRFRQVTVGMDAPAQWWT